MNTLKILIDYFISRCHSEQRRKILRLCTALAIYERNTGELLAERLQADGLNRIGLVAEKGTHHYLEDLQGTRF